MTSRLALSVLAMLIIGVPIGSFAQSADSQSSPKPLPAYTIEFTEYRPDGTSAGHIAAYRSDGSLASAFLRGDGTFVVYIVTSTQDGSFTELHHDVKAKVTTYGPSLGARLEIPKDPTCEKLMNDNASFTESVIGKDEFLGFPVVKRMTQHLDDGDTYESWQAPDLGCKEIFTRKTQKDQETGEVTVFGTEATKIVFGEPQAELFEIPADYEELPPSQIRILRFAKNGLAMTEAVKSSLRYKDEQYWSSQAYKPVK